MKLSRRKARLLEEVFADWRASQTVSEEESRRDDRTSIGFGITFLFINLYTRFFEHFWNPLHKAVFFALLGVSFWFIGSRAERIWTLGGRVPSTEPQRPRER